MNSLASCASTHFMQRASREVARVMEFAGEEKRRILFVEDEADCRQAFSVLFRHASLSHCKVDFAESVNEAMALLVTRVYDLAILDYQLRGETARNLVNEWREYGYELPFIVVSGFSEKESEMRELGSSGFIEKLDSSNPALMERAIRSALSGYWRQRCK